MKHTYERYPLALNYWLVTRKDLERICNFFQKRLDGKKVKNPSIKVETISGNNKEYSTFEEFLECIQQLISTHEEIRCFHFCQYETDWDSWSKDIFINIDFENNSTLFKVYGFDKDGSVKDWVAGACEELQHLVDSFKLDKTLTELVQNKFGKSYENAAVVFDYSGSILEQLSDEVKKRQLQETQERLPENADAVRGPREPQGQTVSSYGQSGGITAGTVNQDISNNITPKQERSWTRTIFIGVLIIIIGGLILAAIKNIIWGG
jgi:hypothetical protein